MIRRKFEKARATWAANMKKLKMNWKLCKISINLEHENAILKQTVASLQKQSAETEAEVNNLEQYSKRYYVV